MKWYKTYLGKLFIITLIYFMAIEVSIMLSSEKTMLIWGLCIIAAKIDLLDFKEKK